MMCGKTYEKGFSLIFVTVMLTSAVLILSVILAFAVRSYKLEQLKCKKDRLVFAAKSGIISTLENLKTFQKKNYSCSEDIKKAEETFTLDGMEIKTFIEDENAKINSAELEKRESQMLSEGGSLTNGHNEKVLSLGKASGLEGMITRFGDGRINLNTADEKILMIFFRNKNDLQFFLKSREEKPLTNLSEAEYTKQKYFGESFSSLNLPFTIKSNCFTIISEASSDKYKVRCEAVFQFTDEEPKQIFFNRCVFIPGS